MCFTHLQLCSCCPQPELCSGALLKSFSQTHLMKTNTGVKTSCPPFSPVILPPSLSLAFSVYLHLHILTSRLLSCSPALRAGVWGLYIGGAACLGDSIAPCVYVCVCVCVSGCVSVDMCMCRMKCRLPPMRHTRRHTCTHRGGGCCVRTEGAVGVLSELDLGFLSFTLHRVGVMA